MDKINFIQSHSIKKQYAVRRWFYSSLISVVVFVSILISIHIKQITTWHSTKQAYEQTKKIAHSFNSLTHKHQALLKKKALFEQRIKYITHLHNKTVAHPFFALAHIQKKHPNITIESCSAQHKKVKLAVHALTHTAIQELMNTVRAYSFFKEVSLDVLRIDKEIIHATIHAVLDYPSEGIKK